MERQLTNIIEYLALSILESEMSEHHPHLQIYNNLAERGLILQEVLNRVPAVYKWLDPEECPRLSQLNQREQDFLKVCVEEAISSRLNTAF